MRRVEDARLAGTGRCEDRERVRGRGDRVALTRVEPVEQRVHRLRTVDATEDTETREGPE